MRRWLVIVLAIGLVGVGAVGVMSLLGTPTTSDIAPPEEPDPELVDLASGQQLWPYYSSERGSFEQRSAINVIFTNATVADVIRLLVDDADWLETDEKIGDARTEAFSFAELEEADVADPLGWGQAVGAERFAYSRVNDQGYWLEETEQLHDGDYYGKRHHLRLYELPGDDPAVAIQAHAEHFDWFTLRHSVTSVDAAQASVEAALIELLGPEHVTRTYHGNNDVYDSDGWVTIIAAILPVLLVTSAAPGATNSPARRLLEWTQNRLHFEHLALAASMVGLLLSVRLLGVGLERHTALPVYWIAGGLFPIIAIGIPVAAFWLGRRVERRIEAAVSASLGLGIAILLDYLYLGVNVLPIEILLHRGGLIIAVGLLAAGGAGYADSRVYAREFILAGVLSWLVLLAMSLFAFL